MSSRRTERGASRPAAQQHGQAALLTVLLLAVGGAAIIATLAAPARIAIENDRATAAALAQARDALIGRAAADSNRPGSLPCPDTNNDGSAELYAGADCPAYVGRLPWRTLGLPDVRDGHGERLWYAVSREYARNPACGGTPSGAACPLNSDTPGTLTTTGLSPANGVVAIVMAPGTALGAQLRDAAGENNAANYLDGENANGDTTFAAALPSDAFNDQLMPITREALFPTVEMRVAREVRQSLRTYYAANGYYPPAATLTGTLPKTNPALYRGRVPTTVSATCPPFLPALPLPAWFAVNNWHQVTIYAVAPRCTPKLSAMVTCSFVCPGAQGGPWIWQCPDYAPGVPEDNCNNTAEGPYLTVAGATNVEAAVLPGGPGLAGQTRPCTAAISDCLEAVGASNENIDTVDNYVYVKPLRSSTNNDGLVIAAP